MLQVRNLPDDVHARLKERAAAERMSLSDYVARELERLVRYRSNAEIIAAARERAQRDGFALTREDILEARDAARAEHERAAQAFGSLRRRNVKTVSVQYAKTHLSALLASVELGEEVVIARGDHPVARLVPHDALDERELGFVAHDVPDAFLDDLPDDELAAWEN